MLAPEGQGSSCSGLRIRSELVEPEVEDNTCELVAEKGRKEAEMAKSRTKEDFFLSWGNVLNICRKRELF